MAETTTHAPVLTGLRTAPQSSDAEWRDYVALLKPRVMSLVVFTGLVGLLVAPGGMHPVIGTLAVLCIAVGAGASGAINMWFDWDIDAVMARTCKRPIPVCLISIMTGRQSALTGVKAPGIYTRSFWEVSTAVDT